MKQLLTLIIGLSSLSALAFDWDPNCVAKSVNGRNILGQPTFSSDYNIGYRLSSLDECLEIFGSHVSRNNLSALRVEYKSPRGKEYTITIKENQ